MDRGRRTIKRFERRLRNREIGKALFDRFWWVVFPGGGMLSGASLVALLGLTRWAGMRLTSPHDFAFPWNLLSRGVVAGAIAGALAGSCFLAVGPLLLRRRHGWRIGWALAGGVYMTALFGLGGERGWMLAYGGAFGTVVGLFAAPKGGWDGT